MKSHIQSDKGIPVRVTDNNRVFEYINLKDANGVAYRKEDFLKVVEKIWELAREEQPTPTTEGWFQRYKYPDAQSAYADFKIKEG